MEIKDQLEASRVVNLLPFVSIPDQVSIVRLKTALRFKPPSVELAKAGVFIHSGDEIWSFTPLSVLTSALEIMLDTAHSQSRSRSQIESDSIGRRVLSWLLRKHFEQYLWRLSAQGLVVETADPSGSRAFFHGQDGKARKISYLTQGAGEASRKVVVQCWGGKRPCFRNEGFGYQMLASEDVLGVAVDPFFLFTGPDTRKPLPYAVQIMHSKHWSTKTGMSHLTFWVEFLTKGEAFVDLRDEHVHNLFLGRSLLQIPPHSALP
jgi:hypothetical protein